MGAKKFPADVGVYELGADERAQIDELVNEVRATYTTADDPELLFRANTLAAGLPSGLVGFLREFQLCERNAGVVVSGRPRRTGLRKKTARAPRGRKPSSCFAPRCSVSRSAGRRCKRAG